MKLTKLFFIACALFVIISCDKKSENLPAFANPDAPEYRALRFFDALYNEKNLGKAQQYSTAKLARILRSYGTVRGYTRYVINLQVDPGVKLKVDRSLNQVSTNKSKETYVNILFDGMHNDSPVKDVRKVIFVRVDGEWLIDEVADDPYMKSGI